jgi:nucleotide-binding universal stress UspA family protein
MYEKILVPIDGSTTAEQGLREATRLAKLAGSRVRVLHVVDLLSFALATETYVGPSPEVTKLLKEGGEEILRKAKAVVEAQAVPVDTVMFENFSSRVADLVVEHAAEWGANLIVLGTHGRRGVGRLMLGSDAEQIARMSPVPVLLVRSKEAQSAPRAAR